MRWFAYAQLVRLPNVFTAMADIVLAGIASGAIQGEPYQFASFACILVASSLLYMAGMVWNDFFDVAQDRRERPGRPIPSGRISARDAAVLGAVLIAAGMFMALVADLVGGRSWTSTILATMLVASIFLYDSFLKRTWAGPFAMGACRFFNVLLGLTAASLPIAPWGYALALSIGVYIVGVTWFARTEARMSKQQTLLTAALVMAGGLVIGLFVPTLALDLPDSSFSATDARSRVLFPYLLALFGVYVGIKVVPAVRDPRPDRVQPAVRRAVLGLVLLDAILATSMVGWPGLLIVVLLAPALWIGRWLYST